MNKDQIPTLPPLENYGDPIWTSVWEKRIMAIDSILTHSQKLAVHFLELLPEGKVNTVVWFDSRGMSLDNKSDCCGIVIQENDYLLHVSFCSTRVRLEISSKCHHPSILSEFSLDSTTIPQEILDLIPDKPQET